MFARSKLLAALAVVALVAFAGFVRGGAPVALGTSDVGYRGLPFGGAAEVTSPTGEKPQSKLWFNDGSWWGVFFERTSEEYRIFRYDWASHSWSDTGTLVDERNGSKADALWDGDHLYVASAGRDRSNETHAARVLRYTYDATTRSYSLDEGFPATVSNGGMEAIVLAKDTAGKLWVTYTQSGRVYVNHSLGDDLSWAKPFVLPVLQGTRADSGDISSIVAFGSKVGVMWSNQIDDAFYFATHEDGEPEGAWQQSTALKGPNIADDHINLKADSSGRVYAAVKTSLDAGSDSDPQAPLIMLLAREADGSWAEHVVGREADAHTRPMVLLDEEHRHLYVFATSPCCRGGEIYYKRTSMDAPSFEEGKGATFLKSATDDNIDNVTSTKQNVDGETGLLAAASDSVSGYYLHNAIDLRAVDTTPPAMQPPDQSLTSGAALGTSTVPVKLTWSATDGQSGVSAYRLQQSADAGPYADVSLSSATETGKTRSLAPGGAYRFRARAMDGASNWSEWAYGEGIVVNALQETSGAIAYGGTWTEQPAESAYGGGVRHTQTQGDYARLTFTGRNVAWVATKDTDRGRAYVFVDGVKVKTVDLYSSTAKPRRMVFTSSWSSSGSHTIEVRAQNKKSAASTGTRVDVDAFVVLGPEATPPPTG